MHEPADPGEKVQLVPGDDLVPGVLVGVPLVEQLCIHAVQSSGQGGGRAGHQLVEHGLALRNPVMVTDCLEDIEPVERLVLPE